MERGDGRAAADRVAVAGEAEARRLARRHGADDMEVDEADRLLSACRHPGPATPVTAIPTSAPSRSRTPRAIAAAASAETAPCSRGAARERRARSAFTVVRVGDDAARRRRRSRPGSSVRRAATRPPVHDSAVRERQPALAAEREHDLLDRPLVLAEQVALERLAQRGCERVRALPRRRARRRGRRGSRSRGRRSSPPRRRRRRPPRASARATADSLAPKKRSDAPAAAATSARGRAAPARSRARRRPQPLQLARRARAARRRRTRRRSSTRPGAVPASPIDDRALGKRRLLADARGEVGVRPAEPLGDRARDTPRSGARARRRRRSAGAGDAGDELDRAVVVRRPEPARDEAEIGLEPLARARPRARRDRRRRSRSARARARARAPRARGTGRCGPCGRRGRARCR